MITPETTPPSIPTNSATAPAGETSATRTSSISLSNGNHPPVAHDDAATAVETGVAPGSDAIGNVLTNDTDVDGGDTKAVTTTGAHALTHGTLTLNADGSFDYAVNNADTVVDALRTATDTLTDTFSYTMTDSQGLTSSANLVITIQGANDAPIAQNDTLSTNEDTPINLAAAGVLANDTDVDTGDTKTVSAVNGVAGNVGAPVAGNFGTLTLFADRHLSFVPNAAAQALTAGTHATDVFTYTVHDTAGATSTASITITINGLNDAPVAHADGNVVAEDSVITATGNVLANDTDAEIPVPHGIDGKRGDRQRRDVLDRRRPRHAGGHQGKRGLHLYAEQRGRRGAAARHRRHAHRHVPLHRQRRQYQFQSCRSRHHHQRHQRRPGRGRRRGQRHRRYDADCHRQRADRRHPDSDTDTGDVLTVTGVTGNGTTNFATGHFTIATTFGTIDINAATGAYTYNLNNGAVQALGATQSTTDVFTYTISDGHGGISSADLTVTIHGTNDAPVANNNTGISVIEDTPTSINVLANDTDVDGPGPLAVTQINSTPVTPGSGIPVAVTGGTVTVNANSVLVFTPDANFNGPVSFTYVAKDGLGATSNAATVSLTVTAVDDAPVNTAPTAVTATEDTAFLFNGGNAISVTDVDSNVTVTLSVDHGVLHASGAGVSGDGSDTLTIASATPTAVNAILAGLSYQGDLNFNGNDTLTIVTSDGTLSDTDTVAITVSAVNDAPVVDLNGATAGVDRTDVPAYTSGAVAINVAPAIASVTDAENAISKITLTLSADVGSLDGSSEGFSLPAGAAAFLTSIGFTVSGEGTSNLQIISNTVGGISPATFEGILKTVLYHDADTTFGFNPEDRTVTVTATDGLGLNSSPALIHIDLAANVTDLNDGGALDHFVGANLADTIRGNGGNDTMEGRGGDDTIYGGTEAGDSGHDTAVFTGNQADYVVTRTGPGVYTVADQIGGRDGTDTVHDVETLHFDGDSSDLLLDAPFRSSTPPIRSCSQPSRRTSSTRRSITPTPTQAPTSSSCSPPPARSRRVPGRSTSPQR